ncbi:MAG: thioredoxin domain-containing protein [Vicinamibacterales bacterium]|nr:thioredoxin domain-containing protein [Vicinamibacterales bacterium]
MPNRLAAEQSPYLLQHAHNPVDWYPWGEEAFARARAEDKPIFLSIGYSTCHWCHVMEHESFESPAIAGRLNRDFVSIKVDREERPDVDRVYMTFVQATTGAGGWPMSVFLTPDLQPFFSGTYFPPTAQFGRPGFDDVLEELARAWREERERVLRSATHIVERLVASNRSRAAEEAPNALALVAGAEHFARAFDARRGGFGDAPKFPRPSELLFLLREHARTGQDLPRDIVLHTLRAMALGGMRDHIGGGFHRYSVDGNWRVPHFEKMLYDQAQIVLACLEAAQVTADPFYAQIAEDTLQYVERELTDRAGGFHSAEDADSVPPEQAATPGARKMEGAFYIWRQDELRAALGDDSEVFERRFGVLPDGNAPFDPHSEFTGRNLLYTARSLSDIAGDTGLAPAEVADALLRARRRLFDVRAARPRPSLDDKVLTAWNGLMIAACARAARVLDDGAILGQEVGDDPGARHLIAARRAATFLRETMWDGTRLLRRYRGGDAAIEGYAEDYAYLIWGLLELVQADGDPAWLAWAQVLQARMDARFWDDEGGAWFSTTGDDPSVLLRMKEDYDGAEPAPSSVAVMNLVMLAHLSGGAPERARAERALTSFGARLREQARGVPMMLASLGAWLAPWRQTVVVGPRADARTRALLAAANRRYTPYGVVLPVEPGPQQAALAELMPWIGAMTMVDGAPAAYVCRNFTCERPVTTPDAL